MIETSASDGTDAIKSAFKILIVDDESDILDMISDILRSEGYSSEKALNGNSALAIMKKNRFDLVIADICMPDLDGIHLAETLHHMYPGIMVALMTGRVDYQTMERGLRSRTFGFLVKPLSFQQLTELVARAAVCKHTTVEQEQYNSMLERAISDKTKELEFRNERLLAERELVQGIVSHANFGLMAVDVSGLVHLMNKYASNLLQVDSSVAATYHGVPMNKLLGDDFLSCMTPLYDKVLSGSDLCETTFACADGDQRLDIIAYPTKYRKRITAVVFVIHDITEKETLQKRLLQSAKLASIGELAAGVAHEINNPLAFVTTNCNTLKGYFATTLDYIEKIESKISENTHEYPRGENDDAINEMRKSFDMDYICEDIGGLLTETMDGLTRVSQIVKDLKTFARADTCEPERHQVNSLIENALNLARNEIKYKLEVQKSFGDIPEINCLPNKLVQVFTNLFINAAHAVDEKGRLEIETLRDGHSVIIKIRDDGAGIPSNVVGKIFDPFFTTKEPGKGTGMGLSISYGIIEKHNGKISVRSDEGKGTEFTILLPIELDRDHVPKNDKPHDSNKGKFNG